MVEKNKGGRPPIFKTSEELEIKIKGYFDTITIDTPRIKNIKVGTEINKEGKEVDKYEDRPVLNNKGEPIIDVEYIEIPTILGLCEYLDIHRSTLLEYEDKPEFSNTIKKAKQIIEKYNELQLYREKQVTGVIFNLKNNFGWVDKSEQDMNVKGSISLLDLHNKSK